MHIFNVKFGAFIYGIIKEIAGSFEGMNPFVNLDLWKNPIVQIQYNPSCLATMGNSVFQIVGFSG